MNAEFLQLLSKVNVPGQDNGEEVTCADRVEAVKAILSHSPWQQIYDGKLTLVYAHPKAVRERGRILYSCHIDSSYKQHFVRDLNEKELLGTFDNSICNAILLDLMLNDHLPSNAIVAFTGDEEGDSGGATETVEYLQEGQYQHWKGLEMVVVLDVTGEGYAQHQFTIENVFRENNPSRHQRLVFENRNALVSYLKAQLRPKDVHYINHNDADPDETWEYDEHDLNVFLLGLPVQMGFGGEFDDDWMHNERGIKVKKEAVMGYARVLRDLSTAIARDIKDPEQQPAIMLGTSVPERPNLAFLKSLMLTNGQGTPKFRQLLERFEAGRDPRFLWYPSAGLDFRDLLFLHEVIWKTSWRKEPIRNAQEVPAAPPDIYIHTDCSEPIDYDKWPRILRPFQPLTEHHVPARPFTLYRDDRTNIRIVHHEEISSDIYFPFTKAQRVTPHFQRSPPILPGRFFYFELQVICKQLGEFHRPMLFFFVENAAFLARAILPCHLRVSHVLSIRQQGKAAENVGLCRGYQKHFFKDMRTEVFISDFNPPDCAENHTEGKPTADRKSPQDDYGLSRIAKTSQSVEMSMFATLPEIEWGGDSKYCFQVTTTPKEVTHYA